MWSLSRFGHDFSFGVHLDRITEWSDFCRTSSQPQSDPVGGWCPVLLFITAMGLLLSLTVLYLMSAVYQPALWVCTADYPERPGGIILPNLHAKPSHLQVW